MYRKNIEPMCQYCRFSHDLGCEEIVCEKRGVMRSWAYCARFRYDPVKRVPEVRAKLDSSKFSKQNFEL